MTTTQTALFYANIDMSAVALPLRKAGYGPDDFVPMEIPCGCPHCGASQRVMIRSEVAFTYGRRWPCVACKEAFLVTLFEGTSAYVPDELHAGHVVADEPKEDVSDIDEDVYVPENVAQAMLIALHTPVVSGAIQTFV